MPDTYGPLAHPSSANAIGYYFGPQNYTRVGGFTFTIGAEAADVITVSIQVKDIRGRNLNRRAIIDVILSSTTFGEADASITTVAVTTGAAIDESATGSIYRVQTDDDGLVVMTFTEAATTDYYLRAVCGDVMVQAASQLVYA